LHRVAVLEQVGLATSLVTAADHPRMPTISHVIQTDDRWAYDGASTGHARRVYGGYWWVSIPRCCHASSAV